jgi:hypothetical protein
MTTSNIESSSCRFMAKPKTGGKPVIQLELFHETVSRLEGVVVEFELLSGTSIADARKLAETMNDRILGISLLPK